VPFFVFDKFINLFHLLFVMKILIIKLGARGDVLRTTSILPSLKNQYKDSEIWWVTEKKSLPLLNNSYVDFAFGYNKKTVENLHRKEFDLVLNLDEDYEACSLASKLKKKKLLGFYLKSGKITPTKSARYYFDMSVLGEKPKNDELKKKNGKTYHQLIHDICEVEPHNSNILLNLDKKQEDFSSEFMRRYNIGSDNLVIGLNTGSGERWFSKRWSVENTAKLAELLYNSLKCKIILFGGPDEIERNDEIISKSNVPIINTGCGNNLFEFPALVNICNLIVTSDSLGLHIALALKRKVVVLFGPTSVSEIETYALGEKLFPLKKVCCFYKNECYSTPRCIDTIKPKNVFDTVKKLLNQKISIIITSFHEPFLENSIRGFVDQEIGYNHEIVVVSPDKNAELLCKKYKIKYFFDPGKGKSYALNLIFKEVKSDILIFTDGDVVAGKNSINEIMNKFRDPRVGVVTGRVVSSNKRNDLFGYWSHLLADAGAHTIRRDLYLKNKFLECSGYLFAFRNNVIRDIPLDVAEDTYIPYEFYFKGYKIAYAENAKVYVKNPNNFKDWLIQRMRTSKAHETLDKYVDIKRVPKVKSFKNEIVKGTFSALKYPKNLREFYWTILLFIARFYMWLGVFYDTKFKNKSYTDAWERIESTK